MPPRRKTIEEAEKHFVDGVQGKGDKWDKNTQEFQKMKRKKLGLKE